MTYVISEADAIERNWSRTDDRDGLWSIVHGRKVMLDVPLCENCDQPVDEDGGCADCDDD